MTGKPTLSLCMVVRNQAQLLDRALKSAKGGYDQLIIVDAGSNDHTSAVARSWGAILLRFTKLHDPYGVIDNFSSSRNVALSRVTTNYWWWMDSDEVVTSHTIHELRQLVLKWPKSAIRGISKDGNLRWFRIRVAPNDGRHVWKGAIHEWIHAPSGSFMSTNLIFEHKPNPKRGNKSLLRNLRILQKEILSQNATYREYFYLARTLEELGYKKAAIIVWQNLLKFGKMDFEHIQFARLYLARLLFSQNNFENAADEAIKIIKSNPNFAEASCLLGDIALRLNDKKLAISWYDNASNSGECPIGPLFNETKCYKEYPLQCIRKILSLGDSVKSTNMTESNWIKFNNLKSKNE